MKISYNWLKEHLEFDLSPEETSALLTSTGLEVESVEKVESIKGGLEGLVVGHVLEKEKHPDADKLSITKVDTGNGEISTIVCGASNVAAGQKVVVALPGTTLFPLEGDSFKIKKAKIRGVESCGMICAEDEIGLGKDHNGIIVLPAETTIGTLLKDYYKIKSDYVFEIGLTPNRIDAASHRGVARDLRAVLAHRKNNLLELKKQNFDIKSGNGKNIPVSIKNENDCKRYCSVVISDVTVGESPEWLKQKLQVIGLRPINNIVDITNYVLHDLGQPLHAFDADKIAGGKVEIRNAKACTSFVTLDGIERKLDGTELMICDGEKEMCIAGIFGGEKSGVTENTKNIFLESAWFHPSSIRKTAKKFGLSTDASFRFERGADISITMLALQKAANLIIEIAGGKIVSEFGDAYPNQTKETEIDLSLKDVQRVTGIELNPKAIRSILHLLDFEIVNENTDTWKIKTPLYRVDVTRAADVIEEILRIYGYNEIPLPEKMSSSVSFSVKPDNDFETNRMAGYLSSNGFYEIMTNSLTSSSQNELQNKKGGSVEAVKVLNPLSSELDILRTGLLLNGLNAVAYNINRQQYDLKLYEFGKIYWKEKDVYKESNKLSLFVTGQKETENWNASKNPVSIYTLTGIIDSILRKAGIENKIDRPIGKHAFLNDCIEYKSGKRSLGIVGTVSKDVLKFADIKQPVFAAELDWDLLMEMIKSVKIKFEELPKFPSVRRDLSLLLDEKIKFAEIESCSRKIHPTWIRGINLFDVYEGKNLEAGKKSYAISFTLYNEEATLTDKEVDKVMNEIIESLGKNLGAVLR